MQVQSLLLFKLQTVLSLNKRAFVELFDQALYFDYIVYSTRNTVSSTVLSQTLFKVAREKGNVSCLVGVTRMQQKCRKKLAFEI